MTEINGVEMTPRLYRAMTEEISRSGPMPKLTEFQTRLLLHALGTNGEAGEIADHVKKHVFHGMPLDSAHLLKEAGDVLWYLDRLLKANQYTLEDAMVANVTKLRARYPDGWDAATKHFGWEDEAQK
jgi:NTP pyrophosphatase (non-canonical NTP hydrolase)